MREGRNYVVATATTSTIGSSAALYHTIVYMYVQMSIIFEHNH